MSQEIPEKIPTESRPIGKSFFYSGMSIKTHEIELYYGIREKKRKFPYLNQGEMTSITEFVKEELKKGGYSSSRIDSFSNSISFTSGLKSRRKNEDYFHSFSFEIRPGYNDPGSVQIKYRREGSEWKRSDFINFVEIIESSLERWSGT